MAGVNKNFVVKNGLEVNSDLIFANATNQRVGINTNNTEYTLHVNGGIGVTNLYVSGIGTFNSIHLDGSVTAGTAGVGSTGQYLVRAGTGVTWQTLPATRSSQTFTASAGQTVFSFSYTVGQLDVFINGVKLSSSEFTANDTASVILNAACFGDETVELISYSSVNPGYGFTGIYGISLFEEGSPVGTTGQVVTLNFVGAAVTATATGAGATIYINDSVNPNYWEQTAAGIHTTSNVGIGTTNPRFALEVGAVGASGTSLWVNGNARVTGILTVGSSSIVLDGANNTINVGSGITINGNTGIVSASNFYASGIQVGVITATTIIYEGGTTLTQDWTRTAAGIHTLSNVGIGTTNPTSKLTVTGDGTFTGVVTATTFIGALTGTATTATLATNAQGLTGTPNITVGTIDATSLNASGVTTSGTLNVGTGGTVITTISAGLVGIGTTNPTSALTVKGNTSLETLSVSGVSTFTNNINLNAGNLKVATDGIIKIGNSDQLELYYNGGTGQVIKSTGDLRILTNRLLLNNSANDEQLIEANQNGSVELYYDNYKKFETLGAGVTVTGTTFTNQLNVSGVSTCTESVRVGVSTAAGIILTSPNGTNYQLFVENDGALKTVAV